MQNQNNIQNSNQFNQFPINNNLRGNFNYPQNQIIYSGSNTFIGGGGNGFINQPQSIQQNSRFLF
jgi:hypothetical protein